MRIVDLVRRIGTIGAELIRGRRRNRRTAGEWSRRPLTARLTVAAWMWSRGVSGPDIARWGGAVGGLTARLARAAGYRPVKVFTVPAGGMYPEYVYPDAAFMEAAWVTPDRKGLTYNDKIMELA
jgi:hypothetical protein